MSESVTLRFRTTRHFRRILKETVGALYESGEIDSESMSLYIRDAVREKLRADSEVLQSAHHANRGNPAQ